MSGAVASASTCGGAGIAPGARDQSPAANAVTSPITKAAVKTVANSSRVWETGRGRVVDRSIHRLLAGDRGGVLLAFGESIRTVNSLFSSK
jgi:hypothetical protein